MASNSSEILENLNADLFRDVLNDGFNTKDVKIKSLTVKLISEGGENYCSDIYRANVKYTIGEDEIKTIMLIVKSMKESYISRISLPSKETQMYTLMIPQMEQTLGKPGVLAPKCFRATNEMYIFQDLEDLGYTLQDRLKGLSEDHAHVLLKKIATFHAASMVIAEKQPDLIEKVGDSYFENGMKTIEIAAQLIYGNLEYVTELSKEWDGCEEIVIKLQNLRQTYDAKLLATLHSKQTKFKVLNHGDLWVNNMLFMHDGDTCVDVRLIDFQICQYASPGWDLHSFFTTSIPLEIALTKKYDLLRTYHKSLKTTLLDLKYSPIPTWDDLLCELRNSEFAALHSIFLAVPFICLEKDVSKGNDLDTLKDPELMKKQRVHIYKSKRTLAITRSVLDRMCDLGILD